MRRCRSRCARWRPQQKMSLFVNEKPAWDAGRRSGEQALRRQHSGGAAAPGRQPDSPAPSRARPSRGGKRARGRVTGADAGTGGARPAGRRARAGGRARRRAWRARKRAGAVAGGAARGCRSTCSFPRARLAVGLRRGGGPAARRWFASRGRRSRRARCTRGRAAALDRCACRSRRRGGTRGAHRSRRARREAGVGRPAHRGQGAPAPPRPRRAQRSTTSSSGWSTPCAPTS